MTALPYDQRPPDRTPIHTEDLPATPVRDRNIVATAWIEAPPHLLSLGDDLGYDVAPEAEYKRRLGPWLLWRSGPATRGHARYLAVRADDLTDQWSFRLFPDGTGEGTAPDGSRHHRFRTWKEALVGRDVEPDPEPDPEPG